MFKKMFKNAVMRACEGEVERIVQSRVKFELAKHKDKWNLFNNSYVDQRVAEKVNEAFSKKIIIPQQHYIHCTEPAHVKGLTGVADACVRRVATEFIKDGVKKEVENESFIDDIINRIKKKQL